MYCPRCKAENSEHFNFCNNCGLNFAAKNNPPPLKEPSAPPIIHKPYKAAYTLGIIGSILISFLIFVSLVIYKFLDFFNLLSSSITLTPLQIFLFLICGAAGIAGSYLLVKEKLIGVVPIFAAALLPTVLYFIYLPMGFASLVFTPLMTAAVITALIRKKQIEKYYSQP